MNTKKLLALGLAGALSVSLLAGCSGTTDGSGAAPTGNPSSNPPQSGKAVELTVVTSYGGDDGQRGNYEAAVKAYEAASGNLILDASATSNEEWKAKVLTDFQTGSEPDVLYFFTNTDAEPFVTAGKVVDVATIRTEYPDYAGNMKADLMATAADGKCYSVPSYGFWENMFVNTKVLADCGIAMPGPDYSWDQFLADCQTIKDKGYTPIACSLFEVPHYWFEYMIMNHGESATQLDMPTLDADGKLVMDETAQKWIDGLNDIKFLYEKGFFPENTLTSTDAETGQLFDDAEAAFLVDGSWKVNHFVDAAADQMNAGDYAIAFAPGRGVRKASDILGGISMGYFITQKAWNDPAKREAAVNFVMHMTSDETLSTFVTTEVTALTNGSSPASLNPLQQSAADANAFVTSVIGPVQDTMTSEAKTALFGSVQSIVIGDMAPEEAITAALKVN